MSTTCPTDTISTSAPAQFRHYWLAETVRVRESHTGPLEDSAELRQVLGQGGRPDQRLMLRAQLLGRREGLDALIRQWTGAARLALAGLVMLALAAGIGTAMAALGDGSHPVNLLLIVGALLGPHLITLLVWLVSLGWPAGTRRHSLGQFWLWLAQKFARGPQAVLVPRALTSLLTRHHMLRPLLGSISHVLWLCALTAMLATLLILLSARRYEFQWETTLLSPDAFVAMTAWLGSLPALLGFATPAPELVRISDGLQPLPAYAHSLWSGWLIGLVVVWGLLPRALALTATVWALKRRRHRLHLDLDLPGYLELRERLNPPSRQTGIDAAPGQAWGPDTVGPAAAPVLTRDRALVGLELPADQPWPPAPLPAGITDLGVMDARHQRQAILDALHARPPQRLLLVCDIHQTPDRGSLYTIQELASHTAALHVLLSAAPQSAAAQTASRGELWLDLLTQIGLDRAALHHQTREAMDWLSAADHSGPDDAPAQEAP